MTRSVLITFCSGCGTGSYGGKAKAEVRDGRFVSLSIEFQSQYVYGEPTVRFKFDTPDSNAARYFLQKLEEAAQSLRVVYDAAMEELGKEHGGKGVEVEK